MLLNLAILPGDGIGPEVTEQAVLVLQAVAEAFGHQLRLQSKNIGGAALTAANDPLPTDTLQACLSSSAVLLGAVGSPAFDHYPNHLRPEAGLLRLRRELGAYANLRPAICFPALGSRSRDAGLRMRPVRGADAIVRPPAEGDWDSGQMQDFLQRQGGPQMMKDRPAKYPWAEDHSPQSMLRRRCFCSGVEAGVRMLRQRLAERGQLVR